MLASFGEISHRRFVGGLARQKDAGEFLVAEALGEDFAERVIGMRLS